MIEHLSLVKPSKEYIDEIRSYRQEFIDDGGHTVWINWYKGVEVS